MPSCKDITEHGSDYLDRHMPWWKRPGYWMHLLVCVHCRRYIEQLRLTIETIGRSPDAAPPVVKTEEVQQIVQQLKQSAKKPANKPRDI
ncbi:MAG TPA: hypothetical protein ENI97_13920 [Gammaproteobacteria bacterium]|nr:hypothetical protein [Gammaproteobacteria bacterium]